MSNYIAFNVDKNVEIWTADIIIFVSVDVMDTDYSNDYITS